MSADKKIETSWAKVRVDVDIPIAATPDLLWQTMTRDVSKWWPISFCANKDRAKSFHWEMTLGGRMYEDWGDGDGWLWWTIFKLDAKNHHLAASGNMGGGGCTSEIFFTLVPDGAHTILRVKEFVTGAIDDPAGLEAGQVQGWNELFRDAFKPYVEKLRQ